MMKPYLHWAFIPLYGVMAIFFGLYARIEAYGGLNYMPILMGVGAFSCAGFIHLAIYSAKTEQRYRRQMLILTRAIGQLQTGMNKGHEEDNIHSAMQAVDKRLNHEDEKQDKLEKTRPKQAKPHKTTINDAPNDEPPRLKTIPKKPNAPEQLNEQEIEPQEISMPQAKVEPDPRDEADAKKLRSLLSQLYGSATQALVKRGRDEHQDMDEEGDEEHDDVRPNVMARPIPTPPAKATSAPPRLESEMDDATLLEKVKNALDEERVKVTLQPIVSLPSRHIMFEECFARLYDEQGMEISPQRFITIAQEAGMMPIIDQLLLYHLLEYLGTIVNQQKHTRYFCNMSAHTINNPAFFKQFLSQLEANPDIISKLIFEVAQADIEQGDEDFLKAIQSLKKVNFKISFDQVYHAGQAIKQAEAMGMDYVKIRGSMLLVYLESNFPDVAAANHYLAKLRDKKLEIIAERVESDVALRELGAYDIRLGQGYLFGMPEPMNA